MEKFTSETRYRFIELLAYWEGRVNTTHLNRQFSQTRQQSSKDFKAYDALASGNLYYDSSLKAYLPTDNFQRHYISDDVHDYLNWLQNPACYLPVNNSHTTNFHHPISTALSFPSRKVNAHIMRALVTALRENRRVEVDYVSLNNPNREGRVIAPHTFVNIGLRWHLRAWCEKSGEYRDFVLSRFRGEPDLLEKTTHTRDQDHGWNTQVKIILQPDPRLSLDKREVLENDYQMQNGYLHITTKGCLVNYLLREMQINTKMLDGTPEAQQLVLVNRADIKPWLFEG